MPSWELDSPWAFPHCCFSCSSCSCCCFGNGIQPKARCSRGWCCSNRRTALVLICHHRCEQDRVGSCEVYFQSFQHVSTDHASPQNNVSFLFIGLLFVTECCTGFIVSKLLMRPPSIERSALYLSCVICVTPSFPQNQCCMILAVALSILTGSWRRTTNPNDTWPLQDLLSAHKRSHISANGLIPPAKGRLFAWISDMCLFSGRSQSQKKTCLEGNFQLKTHHMVLSVLKPS